MKYSNGKTAVLILLLIVSGNVSAQNYFSEDLFKQLEK